jgi:hypothetical protein
VHQITRLSGKEICKLRRNCVGENVFFEDMEFGGPPRSIGTTCSSQSAQSNLADRSIPNIDVSGSEPPKSQPKPNMARSCTLKSISLQQEDINEAYHTAK